MTAGSSSPHNWLAHQINRESLLRYLPTLRGTVLDLGCGESPYYDLVASRASRYLGVDWPNSAHEARHVSVYADLGKDLPFSSAAVDTILCLQVLEHLPEPQAFLRDCHRVLRRGGTLYLTVPFMWHVHEAPHDYYRFTRYGLAYLLHRAGFESVEIEENTGYWQMAALKLNYQTARFARGPLRWLLLPLWWLTQRLSPILDARIADPGEAASYSVLATRR